MMWLPLGDKKKMRELFAKHGVDVDQEWSVEQRDKKRAADEEQMQKAFQAQKAAVYYRYSLWSGDKPLTFDFGEWKPELQKDSKQARLIGTKAYQLSCQMINGKDEKDRNFNVLMNGHPGVGKTSLALAMLDMQQTYHRSVMVVSTAELANLYKMQYDKPDLKGKIDNILRAMKEVDFLVLDDFGTEGGLRSRIKEPGYKGVRTDMQEGIYTVANARFDQETKQVRGNVVLTTNNQTDELTRMYDPKIISRLVPKNPKYRLSFNDMEDVRMKG